VIRTRRHGLLALLAIGLVATASGCTATPSPTPPGSSASPAPTPSVSASPTVEITFDDGELLDPSQKAAWADPLAGAEGYSVVTTDDGDGSWSYKSDDTGCVIGYWHGAPTGDAAAGDSALSDQLLAAQFATTADEISGFAKDDAAPFRTPSELVQTRAVAGADEEAGATYIVAARAFAALGQGFVATLQCPAKTNVADVWSLLSSGPNAFQLVFSRSG